MSPRILFFLITLLPALRAAAVEVPARVHEIARGELAALAADPVVVSAISAQNARGATPASIQAADKRWMETAGVADFMKEIIDSPAGTHLRAWRQKRPYAAEIIVMDNQGANVAITEKPPTTGRATRRNSASPSATAVWSSSTR